MAGQRVGRGHPQPLAPRRSWSSPSWAGPPIPRTTRGSLAHEVEEVRSGRGDRVEPLGGEAIAMSCSSTWALSFSGPAAGEGHGLEAIDRLLLMNSLPLSLSMPRSGMGRRWRTRCTPPPTRSCPLPQTASSSTHRNVRRACDACCCHSGRPGRSRRRTGVVPLGKGANREATHPGRRPPRAGRWARAGASNRPKVATLTWRTFVRLRCQGEFTLPGEPVEELGHEGLQALGADVAGRLPQDFEGVRNGPAVPARAAGARPGSGSARRAPQQADRRLTVQAGDGHDLVQQGAFGGAVAARYRSRCTAAYSRRAARVTDSSLGSEWVTVTSDLSVLR